MLAHRAVGLATAAYSACISSLKSSGAHWHTLAAHCQDKGEYGRLRRLGAGDPERSAIRKYSGVRRSLDVMRGSEDGVARIDASGLAETKLSGHVSGKWGRCMDVPIRLDGGKQTNGYWNISKS